MLGILNNCQFIIYVRYLRIQDLFEMTYGGHLILQMPFSKFIRNIPRFISIRGLGHNQHFKIYFSIYFCYQFEDLLRTTFITC